MPPAAKIWPEQLVLATQADKLCVAKDKGIPVDTSKVKLLDAVAVWLSATVI